MACILVVDDEKDTTELIAMALAGEGYQVIEATGGVSALQLARQHKPDLIILDLMMPDISGLEVCRKVRKGKDTAHIPILMLSVLADVDYKVMSFDAGADDYLSKPVHFSELNSRVQALLKRRAPLRAAPGTAARGKVVAIVSAGGGVGASTAALNLAAAWTEKHPQTVLAELAPGTGGLAWYLGLSPAHGLADWLATGEGQLDQSEIRRKLEQIVVRRADGFDVLLSEQDPHLAMRFEETCRTELFEALVRGLATGYDFVLLDLGHGYNARVGAICALAERVLVVARAQVLSLHAAIRLARLIEEDGVSPEHIHTILVAFHTAPYSLGPEQARQVFQQQDYPYNVLLGFPPMAELIHKAQEAHQAVAALEPQGAKLKDYLQGALGNILE
jgi:CheY-like chemotaxis protein